MDTLGIRKGDRFLLHDHNIRHPAQLQGHVVRCTVVEFFEKPPTGGGRTDQRPSAMVYLDHFTEDEPTLTFFPATVNPLNIEIHEGLDIGVLQIIALEDLNKCSRTH